MLAVTLRIAKAAYHSTIRLPDMETAMTATTVSSNRNRSFSWDHIARRIAEWQRRSRSRQELQGLSDATLLDLGITRCDAQRESRKPFWAA